MSLKTQAQGAGSFAPSLSLSAGETARIMVDVDHDARVSTRHALQRGGACTGDGCKLCAADIPRTTKHIVDAHRDIAGAWMPVSVWLSSIELGKLGEVLPDSGRCIIVITANPVMGDDGKPKTGKTGRPWTDWAYALERASGPTVSVVTADGEVIDGAAQAGLH